MNYEFSMFTRHTTGWDLNGVPRRSIQGPPFLGWAEVPVLRASHHHLEFSELRGQKSCCMVLGRLLLEPLPQLFKIVFKFGPVLLMQVFSPELIDKCYIPRVLSFLPKSQGFFTGNTLIKLLRATDICYSKCYYVRILVSMEHLTFCKASTGPTHKELRFPVFGKMPCYQCVISDFLS